MPKSLADLRSVRPAGRPERSVIACLRPDLVAEVQQATDAIADAIDEAAKKPRRARKMSGREAPKAPKVIEAEQRLEQLLAEMAEHEGVLVVRAVLTDGEWRRWADAHPARAEGEPGHDRDLRVTGGIVNADALLDDMAQFVYSWNGEELTGDDWPEIFDPSLALGDKMQVAREIVSMYEGRMDFQQWRSALSATLRTSGDSASHSDSESPRSASTAGNLEPSSEG